MALQLKSAGVLLDKGGGVLTEDAGCCCGPVTVTCNDCDPPLNYYYNIHLSDHTGPTAVGHPDGNYTVKNRPVFTMFGVNPCWWITLDDGQPAFFWNGTTWEGRLSAFTIIGGSDPCDPTGSYDIVYQVPGSHLGGFTVS